MQINLAPGQSTAEIIIREGVATKQLDPKAPVKTDIVGTIGTILEYLKKRVDAGQFKQTECFITVDRENVTMTPYNQRKGRIHTRNGRVETAIQPAIRQIRHQQCQQGMDTRRTRIILQDEPHVLS